VPLLECLGSARSSHTGGGRGKKPQNADSGLIHMTIRHLHWEGQLCVRLKTDVDNVGRETQEYFVRTVRKHNMRPEREAGLMPGLIWWAESRNWNNKGHKGKPP
jgi:hypothetical protein